MNYKDDLIKASERLKNYKRVSNLDKAEVARLVIYFSCWKVLDLKNKGVTMQEAEIMSMTTKYANEALLLFPSYTNAEALHAPMGTCMNLTWDGMWDHLREYFISSMGIKIDDVIPNELRFFSLGHKRYENHRFVEQSNVERIIKIVEVETDSKILISIHPTMGEKECRLFDQIDNKIYYNGYGNAIDYKFIVVKDDFGNIQHFTCIRSDNLRLEYFENEV